MKYIITESKINKFVSMYLDSKDFIKMGELMDREDFDVTEGNGGELIFQYLADRSLTMPEKMFYTLYVNDELVMQIIRMFGIDAYDAIRAIIDWFNKKYNKKLTEHDFEYLPDNNEYDD
jgi:hypothetical protein